MEKRSKAWPGIIYTFSRLLAGGVFVFSGFVKGVDPLGTAIKFTDYFTAFRISFLTGISEELAIILILAEFMVGVCLVLGIRINEAAWGALLFMGVFLPLTLFIAIFNPVSDCGCFGDALVLSNWATFWKNVAITIPIIYLFIIRKQFRKPWSGRQEILLFTGSLVFMMMVSAHALRHLPLLDFRPYHVGSYLPEKLVVPSHAPLDEYETTLVYEKDGVTREFSLEDFPWQDSTWVWVETRTRLIREGYHPPIRDFSVILKNGEDITTSLLEHPGYVFLLISHDLEKASKKGLLKADSLAMRATAKGHLFYGLTSSPERTVSETSKSIGLLFPFAFTDETVLKTIIRSNPGLILLKEGTILAKWGFRKFPSVSKLERNLLSYSLDHNRRHGEGYLTIGLFAVFFVFVFLTRSFIH